MTSPQNLCPVCETGTLTPMTFDDNFTYKGKNIHIEKLHGMHCDHCGADPILPEQILLNQQLIADAKRQAFCMYTGEQIRQIRVQLKLSQKESAELFGGGANAFSKYERGEVIQSDAMDSLLFLAHRFPFALDALRERHGQHERALSDHERALSEQRALSDHKSPQRTKSP